MFLKAIFSVVRPSPLALQAAANLAGSLLGTPDLELHVFDKTGAPEFHAALERILRIAPPDRVHLETRPLTESYTATLLTVPVAATDQVVLVHDDDAWMGRIGGLPKTRASFAAVLPTIVTFGHTPLIAWAPEGATFATAGDARTRLKSMRFDMRQFTPYPFLFGALGHGAWSAFSRFLAACPMHLPTWDRVMALATLAQGPSALATDWTYFYDYGKWNTHTAHDEYIKGLDRLGFSGHADMGALLLRTLHGLDQLALLDLMDNTLVPEDSQAILEWIVFDTIGYFRRKLNSGEVLTPSLAGQWQAVHSAHDQAPNALLEVMLGHEFPGTIQDLGAMLVEPLRGIGHPALEPQLAFWTQAIDGLAKRSALRGLKPALAWEG